MDQLQEKSLRTNPSRLRIKNIDILRTLHRHRSLPNYPNPHFDIPKAIRALQNPIKPTNKALSSLRLSRNFPASVLILPGTFLLISRFYVPVDAADPDFHNSPRNPLKTRAERQTKIARPGDLRSRHTKPSIIRNQFFALSPQLTNRVNFPDNQFPVLSFSSPDLEAFGDP